jgi:hypothetical protein
MDPYTPLQSAAAAATMNGNSRRPSWKSNQAVNRVKSQQTPGIGVFDLPKHPSVINACALNETRQQQFSGICSLMSVFGVSQLFIVHISAQYG